MVFLKNNRFFFTFFAFWQGVLLIYLFYFPKGQEFLFLDRFHHLYLDVFFKSITLLGDWPAYIFALAFLFFKAKVQSIFCYSIGQYFSSHHLIYFKSLLQTSETYTFFSG